MLDSFERGLTISLKMYILAMLNQIFSIIINYNILEVGWSAFLYLQIKTLMFVGEWSTLHHRFKKRRFHASCTRVSNPALISWNERLRSRDCSQDVFPCAYSPDTKGERANKTLHFLNKSLYEWTCEQLEESNVEIYISSSIITFE
jgi:hypothetical protein